MPRRTRVFFAVLPLGLLVLFVALVAGTRLYQASNLRSVQTLLDGLPGEPVPIDRKAERDGDLLAFTDQARPYSYVRIRLGQREGGCSGFWSVQFVYQAADPNEDWSFPVAIADDTREIYAPVLASSYGRNVFVGLRAPAAKGTCITNVSRIDLGKANGRVLPLVYALSAPDHFHVEPLRLTLEQTVKLYAFGPLNPLRAHTCEEVSSLSRATDGLRSYHHNGPLPRYIRFRVGDGGDNVYSDHLDIIDPALAISGRRWPLQQLKIVDIQYGIIDVQIDRSVTGKPLSVGGRGFADGFGVHSMTDLTLEVPAFLRGQPGEVAFSYGIDDDTAGAGSADLEVCYY